MPKATRSVQHEKNTIENVVLPEEVSEQEDTNSDQEQEDVDLEVFFQAQPQWSNTQVMPSMYKCHT